MSCWAPIAPHRPPCPHRRLRRLVARALPHGATLGGSTIHPWASANFVGARHVFRCTTGEGGDAVDPAPLQQRLDAAEWALAGQIVADILVERDGQGLRIEVLTVED